MNNHISDKLVLLLSTHRAYSTQIWYQIQVFLNFFWKILEYQYIIQLLELFLNSLLEKLWSALYFALFYCIASIRMFCCFQFTASTPFLLEKKIVCMYKYIKNINSTSLKLLRYPVKTFISRWILFFRLGKNSNNYYVKQQQQQQEP